MNNGNSGWCGGALVNKGLLFCYLKQLLCVYFCTCKSIKASFTASNEALTTAERGIREGGKTGCLYPPTAAGNATENWEGSLQVRSSKKTLLWLQCGCLLKREQSTVQEKVTKTAEWSLV